MLQVQSILCTIIRIIVLKCILIMLFFQLTIFAISLLTSKWRLNYLAGIQSPLQSSIDLIFQLKSYFPQLGETLTSHKTSILFAHSVLGMWNVFPHPFLQRLENWYKLLKPSWQSHLLCGLQKLPYLYIPVVLNPDCSL